MGVSDVISSDNHTTRAVSKLHITVMFMLFAVHIQCCRSPGSTHKNTCMQAHISDLVAVVEMLGCSSYEKHYTLVFLGRREEEEEEMMKRCKLRIITNFFFRHCWSNFPSLLYPVCLSVA